MTGVDPFCDGLEPTPANFAPLTPLSFLNRVAEVHPDRVALVHGPLRATWGETAVRCRRLASALSRRGVGRHDVVAIMAPNVPAMYEAHFGVPMTGAVLNPLNIRLDAATLAFMLQHGGAKVLITDGEFADVIERALARMDRRPLVVDIDDPLHPQGRRIGELTYEALLAEGDPGFHGTAPADEWDAISLSYTSGTTGDPKGVIYHHRGAYLAALSNILAWSMDGPPTYLWTLPMFHCNGWCFPWSIAAVGGTNICLRRVEAGAIGEAIRAERVTHMCGAPIVYGLMLAEAATVMAGVDWRIRGQVAGAPPPPSLLHGAADIGLDLTHVYGLTETYGPAAVSEVQEHWAGLSPEDRADRVALQGVRGPLQEAMTVIDPSTGIEIEADGETVGEIAFRGNIVMKGYLKNPAATGAAFAGGWFRTGDLAVKRPDGYVKIRDRSKDVIISGGENISSIEVEEVLYEHPAVLAVAVVAEPHPRWGETPCAFVQLREHAEVAEAELFALCRDRLAAYKRPRRIVFQALPRTSTGKIQKFLLRDIARGLAETKG